jgi:predicted RNA-binding Zn-ribbon protein involved in translation (DUF1610 family)
MRQWLQQAGALRRATEPEPALITELFRQSADKFACPDCGAALAIREVSDEVAFGGRKCEGCQQAIPAARLAAVPQAVLCAACQEKVDRGEPVGEAEYCPRCGGIMVLRKSTQGITRYTSRCSSCGR